MRKYLFIKLQAICSLEIIRNSEAGLVFVCTMFPTFSNKQAYFDFMTKTIAKKITVSWNNEQFSWVLANDHEIPESLLFLPGLERQESEDCGLADTDYTSLKLKFSKLYDILLLGGEKSFDYEAKPNSCKFWFKLTINFLHSHVDTSHDL